MAKKPRPNLSPGGRSSGPIGRARKAWIDRVLVTDLETLTAYGELMKGPGKFYAKPQLMPDGPRYKPGREEIAALRNWDSNPVSKKARKQKEPK